MKATKLFDNIEESFIYLERYVNDGSPSGFTKINNTSSGTNPFTGKDKFYLYEYEDGDCDKYYFGENKEGIFKKVNYIHPDSINSEILKKFKRKVIKSKILVSPTSSARTMLIRDNNIKGFIKLTYDISRIGRCDRQISFVSALSSYEVSEKIKEGIDKKLLPTNFSILLENKIKVTKLKENNEEFEWGTIFREFKPYPYKNDKMILVPAFSLFSKDINNINEEKLIIQFIQLSKIEPKEYLLNLLKMIVDAYWGMVINLGLCTEMHSQNCMFEVDESFNIIRIVIKDMEDVDKDLRIARFLNINTCWKSETYKCFDVDNPVYKYRSSYMYDFKLGEYLLKPIIDCVCEKYNYNNLIFESKIKEYVKIKYLNKLPKDYFPLDGKWYNCQNIEIQMGQTRKFIEHDNPKFR